MAKRKKLRRDDTCVECGEPQAVGATAFWSAAEKVARCVSCHEAHSAPSSGSEQAPAPPTTAQPPAADIAGRSAAIEYEKRAMRERQRKEKRVSDDAEWRENIREQRPVLGRVATAFTPKPQIDPESQATKAWKVGAEGEQRVAEVLAGVAGVEVLHDRLMPGSRSANIDHIAVGPSGVFVIDAKKYTGKIEARDAGGWFKTDERLYVNNRDRTKTVDGVLRQVEAVAGLLVDTHPEVPVRGVLCFIGCDWGWFMRAKHVKGVTAIWPTALADHVSVDGVHAGSVVAVAEFLRTSLRIAR